MFLADGRILYLDEKRSQAHLAVRKGSNYPTAGRKADFTDNIRRFWANVKWKKSGKTNFTAQGNTNELPEWKKRLAEFSERYSAEPTDAAYMKAVERRDTESAQRMVDEAAKKFGKEQFALS